MGCGDQTPASARGVIGNDALPLFEFSDPLYVGPEDPTDSSKGSRIQRVVYSTFQSMLLTSKSYPTLRTCKGSTQFLSTLRFPKIGTWQFRVMLPLLKKMSSMFLSHLLGPCCCGGFRLLIPFI